MVNEEQRTYEATMKLLSMSRNNESAIEQYLAKNGDKTTGEIARGLNWTLNKTNSTLYRMEKKRMVEFFHFEDKNHRVTKGIKLTPIKSYFK